jgi:quinol monooxygenase YgiN
MELTPNQIVIAGTIDVDPSRFDACMSVIEPLQAATRRDEPGCLAYVFAADPCVPGRIQVYERWADADTLAAHFEHPNYIATRDALYAHGIVASVTERMLVTHAQSVYDADRVCRPHRWD